MWHDAASTEAKAKPPLGIIVFFWMDLKLPKARALKGGTPPFDATLFRTNQAELNAASRHPKNMARPGSEKSKVGSIRALGAANR